jgi:hypothetical protein
MPEPSARVSATVARKRRAAARRCKAVRTRSCRRSRRCRCPHFALSMRARSSRRPQLVPHALVVIQPSLDPVARVQRPRSGVMRPDRRTRHAVPREEELSRASRPGELCGLVKGDRALQKAVKNPQGRTNTAVTAALARANPHIHRRAVLEGAQRALCGGEQAWLVQRDAGNRRGWSAARTTQRRSAGKPPLRDPSQVATVGCLRS